MNKYFLIASLMIMAIGCDSSPDTKKFSPNSKEQNQVLKKDGEGSIGVAAWARYELVDEKIKFLTSAEIALEDDSSCVVSIEEGQEMDFEVNAEELRLTFNGETIIYKRSDVDSAAILNLKLGKYLYTDVENNHLWEIYILDDNQIRISRTCKL